MLALREHQVPVRGHHLLHRADGLASSRQLGRVGRQPGPADVGAGHGAAAAAQQRVGQGQAQALLPVAPADGGGVDVRQRALGVQRHGAAGRQRAQQGATERDLGLPFDGDAGDAAAARRHVEVGLEPPVVERAGGRGLGPGQVAVDGGAGQGR